MLEAFTFQNRGTGRSVTQLTFGEMRFVHSYYDVPPWSPTDGSQILFASDATETAQLCVIDIAK